MSRLVQRRDIVDYATYEDSRAVTRPMAMAAKQVRRVSLGDHLNFAFENRDTLRYQIQEIMRVERIVRDADIVAEIDTYNALLGEPGDLGCVLMIEIESETERTRLLSQWLGLPEQIYVRLADGMQIFARFDPGQVGDERLSAVQYLQFPVMGRVPVAVGTDFRCPGESALLGCGCRSFPGRRSQYRLRLLGKSALLGCGCRSFPGRRSQYRLRLLGESALLGCGCRSFPGRRSQYRPGRLQSEVDLSPLQIAALTDDLSRT